MLVTGTEFAHMMDGTLIQSGATWKQTEELLECALKYHFHSVFAPRPFYDKVSERLKGTEICFGCGSGPAIMPTDMKCRMVEEGLGFGCNEFDMVMNIPAFKSGMYDRVVEDIQAVKAATKGNVVKCIIEAPLLSDTEIRQACELVIEGGADFIKTAVGSEGPTTLHHVEVIANAVRDRIKIKAAGGIRTLEAVDKMIELGVSRFGVSYQYGLSIIEAANNR